MDLDKQTDRDMGKVNAQGLLIQLLLDKHITIDQFTVLYAPFSQDHEKNDYIESEDGKRFIL